MVGLGETREEVLEVMVDLRSASCDVITIGQYLSPSAAHHPVVEYVKPEIFEKYHRDALRLGFRDAASGPFVRSSYMAEKYYQKTRDEGRGVRVQGTYERTKEGPSKNRGAFSVGVERRWGCVT